MLWPLADKPRLAPGVPGGTTPVRLMDDELATSLAAGGRLDTLLGAAEFATSPAVDPDGEVTRALCLAVDPDLLVTVNAMTAGYTVVGLARRAGHREPPRHRAGRGVGVAGPTARAGAAACASPPRPYAQADLDALQRVGDAGLSSFTVNGAADLVEQILGVPSTRGATLVGDGPLNGPRRRLAQRAGQHGGDRRRRLRGRRQRQRRRHDRRRWPRAGCHHRWSPPRSTPAVGAALAAAGTDPVSPSYLDSSLAVPLHHDSSVARRQNAVAALLWRGLDPEIEPRGQILMPPLVWSLQPDDAQAVLTAFASTIHAGLATPRPLTAVIAETAADPQPPQPVSAAADADTAGRFGDAVIGQIVSQAGRLWGLTAALTTNQQTGLTGPQYTAPLREDMLRALSQSEPADTRNGLAGSTARAWWAAPSTTCSAR